MIDPELTPEFKESLSWADAKRRLCKANADTPDDARLAVELGAEGSGLSGSICLRIAVPWCRMILATLEERAALELLPCRKMIL